MPEIIKEIERAEKFVKIAMFQIHNKDVFKILSDKAKQGLRIEVLTLPYDSINDDIRSEVISRFKELEKNGATIYLNKWNVGDPSRTTTAVGRWYSFHGKFIVTDKSAIALSANFTESQELDGVIIFRGDNEKIREFSAKFDELLSLFVNKSDGFDGIIRQKILGVIRETNPEVFELPENVDLEHEEHWIRHYPMELCQSNAPIEEKLCLTPFDCKGRDFITSLIEDANEYVYISTESFTDEDFSKFLVNVAINGKLQVKIFSGTKSMDFTDRVNNMLRDLLAQQIDIRTTDEDLHAKLIITDKIVMVSSINLNRINLGWNTSSKFWRENTESLLICKDPAIVKSAKEKYLEVFNRGYDVKDKLSEKLEELVTSVFIDTFKLRSKSDVKKLFSRFILKRQIDIHRLIIKIGGITKQLMDYHKRNMVTKEDFLSAMLLYYLSERKQDYDELNEKIHEVYETANLQTIISGLEFSRFIEKENDYYKINIDSLIKKP
jgi:phosphatidylserine/phosphatidylglycerophosphate/cardiolipin synthase-like enzyme